MRLTISRRELLQVSGAFAATSLVPLGSFASLVGGRPENLDPQLLRTFMRRYHAWHSKSFFNFDKQFSEAETNFLNLCTDAASRWSFDPIPNVSLSLFTYSYRIKDEKMNASRIAYGAVDPDSRLRVAATAVAKRQGVDLAKLGPENKTIGLGWDFEANDFKVYFFEPDLKKVTEPAMKELIAENSKVPHHNFGLRSYTFKSGKLAERKIYVCPITLPKTPFNGNSSNVMQMITDKRGIVNQYDIKDIEDQALKPTARNLIAKISKQFSLRPDTITYASADDLTLYYP